MLRGKPATVPHEYEGGSRTRLFYSESRAEIGVRGRGGRWGSFILAVQLCDATVLACYYYWIETAYLPMEKFLGW